MRKKEITYIRRTRIDFEEFNDSKKMFSFCVIKNTRRTG